MLKAFISVVMLSVISDVVHGKFVFRENIDGWIKPYKVVANWDEASRRCHDRGAVLASPITDELLFEMRSIIDSHLQGTSFYLGIIARYSDYFVSEEGVALEDMPEMYNTGPLDPEKGKCLSMSSDGVHVVPCSSKLPYMCYKKRKPNNMQLTECGTYDTEYKYVNATGSCYKLHLDKAIWVNAFSVCAMEGAHLAVINDQREAQAITALQKTCVYYPGIGMRLQTNGKWESIHGEPVEQLYNEWDSKTMPTNPYYSCAYLYCDSSKLDAYNCDTISSFLCEMDPNNTRFSFQKKIDG